MDDKAKTEAKKIQRSNLDYALKYRDNTKLIDSWPEQTALKKTLAKTLFPANTNGAWTFGDAGGFKQLYVYKDGKFVSAITIQTMYGHWMKKAKKTKKIYDMLAELDDCYINHPTTVLWIAGGVTIYEVSVLRYCPTGSWFDALKLFHRGNGEHKYTLEDSELIGLGTALAKIHAEGYAMLDIKRENIVFCDCGEKLLQASFIDLDGLVKTGDNKLGTRTPSSSVIYWMNHTLSIKFEITPILLQYEDWFGMAMLVVMNYGYGQSETAKTYFNNYQNFLARKDDTVKKPDRPKLFSIWFKSLFPPLVQAAIQIMDSIEKFSESVLKNQAKKLYTKRFETFKELMIRGGASAVRTNATLNLRW